MTDEIHRGDFYEDCGFRPMLCVRADCSAEGDELLGISLVSPGIGSCSPRHCGPVKLTVDEAIDRAMNWEQFSKVEISRRVAEIEAEIRRQHPDEGVG